MTIVKRKVVDISAADGSVETYEIAAFAATKSIKVFQKLAKLLGPAFTSLQDAGEDASTVAIAKLLETMDEVALDELLKDLISNTTKGSMVINFDNEFQADLGKLVKLAQEVVALNYNSLFTMLGTAEESLNP